MFETKSIRTSRSWRTLRAIKSILLSGHIPLLLLRDLINIWLKN